MSCDSDPDAESLLSAAEAARMLGVRIETLLSWEQQFGFPIARASSAGEATYPLDQVAALRDELAREFSVAAAIEKLRRRGSSPGRY